MTLSNYRVWTCKNLYAPFEFAEIEKCNVRSVRFENKGLGAAQIDVDLRRNSVESAALFQSGLAGNNIADTSTGTYIFIQRNDMMTEEELNNSSYTLTSPWDPSIFWWGYISARHLEIQARSNDTTGSLDCLELGHAVNKFKVRYPVECRNGFNPQVSGQLLGNKRIVNDTHVTFTREPKEYGLDPTETSKYWTVREVVDFNVHYGTPFQISADWSLLEDSMLVDQPNRWLEQYESIPSYESQDLTSALEDIFDTLGWTYRWDAVDEELMIRFFDPAGEMLPSGIVEYTVPVYAKQFSITAEEQSYKRVVLRGDRVLVASSVSTYGKYDSLRLNKDWTDEQTATFVNPLGTAYNIHTIEDSFDTAKLEEAIDAVEGQEETAKENAKAQAVEAQKKKILANNKAQRQMLPNVYQHFLWGMCDSTNVAIAGDCLATSTAPGNWQNEKLIGEGSVEGRVFPMFPYVTFMRPAEAGKSIDELFNDIPEISDEMNLHQTPIASEMIFEESVPWKPYEKQHKWFNQPKFYYRTAGKADTFSGNSIYDEVWQYGDLVADGLMSSNFELDWQGIKLTSPQPESFATPFDYLWEQGATDPESYTTTLQKFDYATDEWKAEDAISDYDPWRVSSFIHKGHWGRLIFSFASRSNQRLQYAYGEDTSTDQTKFEDDDTLQCWIVRKGFVPYLNKDTGTGGAGTIVHGPILPHYVVNDEITRYDNDIAKARLKALWNFWSKPKRAIQVILPTRSASGMYYDPGTAVGNFINQVIDAQSAGTTWVANSYVASIEYTFDSMAPNIVISTEYPASPRRTREKRLKASNVMRFSRYTGTNQGVK